MNVETKRDNVAPYRAATPDDLSDRACAIAVAHFVMVLGGRPTLLEHWPWFIDAILNSAPSFAPDHDDRLRNYLASHFGTFLTMWAQASANIAEQN